MTKKKHPTGKKTQSGKIAPAANVHKNEALSNIDPEQRCGMIAEKAYLIAEQRDFQGEAALDDWLQAEADVDARLSARTQAVSQKVGATTAQRTISDK